jgi:protease-4
MQTTSLPPTNPRPGWRIGLQRLQQGLDRFWQWLVCGLANLRRRLFHKRLPDYVVFVISQELAERTPFRPWWHRYLPGYQPPVSLDSLSAAFRRIASDPDVKGIVLLFKAVPLGLVQAQNLAALFDRFRQWDRQDNGATATKQVIVHLEQVTHTTYIAACAADRVLVTPLTQWDVRGFHSSPTFWKETLALAGIALDVVKVAPWKTAFDPFTEPAMTPEYEAQVKWLYDSIFADLVAAIQQGRGLSDEKVRSLIDGAPWTAEQAQKAALIDGIAYEDELPALLGEGSDQATLKPYSAAHRLLFRRPLRHHRSAVGVLSLTGAIIPGRSRSFPLPLPLFGEEVLGHLTAQQQIRAARQNPGLAAVVAYVDSRGGSALASDLIWRELKLLSQEKPLVVYMGSVAGSGGYYISLPGRQIVAQRATMTGSIGVITGKPVLQDAYTKLQARRYSIKRGNHADLYSEGRPWPPSQRAKIEEGVRHNYAEFKRRVAESRGLPYEELDAVCSGKVWTGAQALQHGLVDELGDFQVAVERACKLANLPTDGSVRVVDLAPPKEHLLARPAQLEQWVLAGWLPDALLSNPLQSVAELAQMDRFWLLVSVHFDI